jgi:8-oxo-dGTP pyrophosphatase MutT (NUDIX family)
MEKLILVSCMLINEKKEILLLFKTKGGYYETPGGKVRLETCKDPENPTIEEMKSTTLREAKEEIGEDVKVGELEIFSQMEFTIPDGREAKLTKFLAKSFSGTPKLMEPEIFDHLKWIPIKNFENYSVSPDLKELTEKMKKELL